MRTLTRPAATRGIVGERGIVISAAGGVGRAAVDGDIWPFRYPRHVTLRPRQEVRVVGQGADDLLVMPAATHDSPPSPVTLLPRMRPGRRR